MTPMHIGTKSRYFTELNALAFELAKKSGQLTGAVPAALSEALAGLVRTMNCYYSNFIEGHNTLPIDIERALRADYSKEPHKRDLQLEAKAHIAVQQWIDQGGLTGRATTATAAVEIHKRFCELLPPDFLWVMHENETEREPVIPGELRRRGVSVAKHIPVSAGALPRFLDAYENAYANLDPAQATLACAAAHHRLLWIHPFIDGNGRVARLVSHAILLEALGTRGLWSIARGLARNVGEYKSHLAQCDEPRWNDYDGRGALSEKALADLTKFFLERCIDQVEFMSTLMQPARLATRILRWTEEEIAAGTLPARSGDAMQLILNTPKGLLPGELADKLGLSDRQTRRIIADLKKLEVVTSDSQRSPFKLQLPVKVAAIWLPGLLPDS